jgi:hypothetical protein
MPKSTPRKVGDVRIELREACRCGGDLTWVLKAGAELNSRATANCSRCHEDYSEPKAIAIRKAVGHMLDEYRELNELAKSVAIG